MRHFKARQRESDKRWDYTCSGREGVYAVGYCADAGGGHHETEMEARECYMRWLLDKHLRFSDGATSNSRHRCRAPGCEEWTGGYATLGGSRMWVLCAQHRTRETVASLEGAAVGESWES